MTAALPHVEPDVEPENDDVREWVRRTCAASGVSIAITDPQAIRQIAALLKGET